MNGDVLCIRDIKYPDAGNTLAVEKMLLKETASLRILEYLAMVQGKGDRDGSTSANLQSSQKDGFDPSRLNMATHKHEWKCTFMTEVANIVIGVLKKTMRKVGT